MNLRFIQVSYDLFYGSSLRDYKETSLLEKRDFARSERRFLCSAVKLNFRNAFDVGCYVGAARHGILAQRSHT